MLVGLLAVCLATVLSVWLQFHLSIHARPVLDQGFPLKLADPQWRGFVWDHAGSFPSDGATLFFGLAAVMIGLGCFLWVAAIVAIRRVIFGWHYPSDIIGSVVLGPGCVFLFSKIRYLQMLAERTLVLFEGRMYFVHAFLFIFLAEASNLFLSLEEIGKYLVRM